MKNKKYIDLHIHTNNSDGCFEISEIIEFAQKENTYIISITDHDTIKALESLQNCLPTNMIGINGVEFSSYIFIDNKRFNIHILGYGFDKNNIKIVNLLNEMKEKRIEAHIKALNEVKLRLKSIPEKSLSKIDFERYCWFDREIIKCMEYENYSLEIITSCKEYFKKNKFRYGSNYDLNYKRVIDAIKSAGGYVIFAHPMAYGLSNDILTKIINQLIINGIDGIEVFQSDCSKRDSDYLMNIVNDNFLLYSVGSDFHRLINSDGRKIGTGIDNNLCITNTSLTNKLIREKLYIKGR